MNWLTYQTSFFFLFFGTTLAASAERTFPRPWATTRLEKRLEAIDQELENTRSSTASKWYRANRLSLAGPRHRRA